MYSSQYYTCEQIDQRLLQGYLDDYNSKTGQNITKDQFISKLAEVFSPTFLSDYFTRSEINGILDIIITNGFIYGGPATPNGTPILGGDSEDNYRSQLFFIATQPGTYTNYGGVVIPNYGFHIILFDTSTWSFNTVFTYDNIGYFECDTAAGTAAKTVSATGFVLINGGALKIKMVNTNTANNATLNINSTGAKPLIYDGVQASADNSWESGEVLDIYYDAIHEQFMANNAAGSDKFDTGEKIKEIGIDDEPTTGSDNLVKSGGIVKIYGTDELFTLNGYFIRKSDGKCLSTTNEDRVATPFLVMPDKIRFSSLFKTSTAAPICFYDKDNAHIPSEIEQTDGVLTKSECPEGTVYIRCSGIVGQSSLFGYTINELYNMTVGSLITNEEMDDVLDGELPIYLTDIDGNAVLDNSGKPIEII